MLTATQSYGNTTIGSASLDPDKKYPVLRRMDGYFMELPPMSIRTYLDGVGLPFQANKFPDFIVASKKDSLIIKGVFTVLNAPVSVVPLLDVPIPTEGDDIGAVFLITVSISGRELKTLIDRIPPIAEGYDINTTYILIHDSD